MGQDLTSINLSGLIENWVDKHNWILKIRVSAVQPRRAAPTDARSAPKGRAKRVHSTPGHQRGFIDSVGNRRPGLLAPDGAAKPQGRAADW